MGAVTLDKTTIAFRPETFPGVGTVQGLQNVIHIPFTMSSSYATDGDTVDFTTAAIGAGAPNAGAIIRVDFAPFASATFQKLVYDKTNHKIIAYTDMGTTQVTSTTSLSGVTGLMASVWYLSKG